VTDARSVPTSRRFGGAYRPPAGVAIRPAGLPGCFEIEPPGSADDRGRFVKPFHAPTFAAHGLASDFAEAFYTVSRRGALRGMHFQLPPHAHAKLVYCVAGAVLDVLLDLRAGSPSFGEHRVFELDGERPMALYLPPGVAHGFYATTEATLVYHVTTPHAPQYDAGVRWDSFGMVWPAQAPILSARDRSLPGVAEFTTPFAFTAENGPGG
jgi:dTDP-4-dehydrorhamnose 3,5-epimerase